MNQHRKNEDLSGYIRGGHIEGDEVCKAFLFQRPGRTPGLWGWNDTSALFCGNCDKLATEHIVLSAPKEPKPPGEKKKKKQQLKAATAMSEAQINGFREAQAAAAKLQRTDLDMLDESVDPLSIAAQAPEPKPVPPPPPQPRPTPPPAVFTPAQPTQIPMQGYNELIDKAGEAGVSAARGSFDKPTGADAERNEDPDVAAALAREKAYSDAFKDEVEKMVRESIAQERRKELNKELDDRLPPSKPKMTKADAFTNVAALLNHVKLPQYVAQFEDEAMDPATLYDVMQHQGRSALEEVLKELGVTSMGHRMKIANAVA